MGLFSDIISGFSGLGATAGAGLAASRLPNYNPQPFFAGLGSTAGTGLAQAQPILANQPVPNTILGAPQPGYASQNALTNVGNTLPQSQIPGRGFTGGLFSGLQNLHDPAFYEAQLGIPYAQALQQQQQAQAAQGGAPQRSAQGFTMAPNYTQPGGPLNPIPTTYPGAQSVDPTISPSKLSNPLQAPYINGLWNKVGISPANYSPTMREIAATSESLNPNATPYSVAASMVGQNSYTPTLAKYLSNSMGGKIDPTNTPWCAALANSVLSSTGIPGTGSLSARSFLKWGNPTNNPQQGDIVVLSRGPDSSKGHVGFYAGKDANGNIKVLGGNQGSQHQVSVETFSPNRVLGFRTAPTPDQIKQTNGGLVSQNQPTSNTMNTDAINQIKLAAPNEFPNNPIMQELAVVQAVQESGLMGNHTSTLAAQHNNYYGIKAPGTNGTVNMPTTEYVNGRPIKVNAAFGKNKTIQDSVHQYSQLMQKPRYANVMNAKTFEDAANGLVQSGYATDPNYAKELIRIHKQLYGT